MTTTSWDCPTCGKPRSSRGCPRCDRYIVNLKARLAEVAALRATLTEIGAVAHGLSTGPTVPDGRPSVGAIANKSGREWGISGGFGIPGAVRAAARAAGFRRPNACQANLELWLQATLRGRMLTYERRFCFALLAESGCRYGRWPEKRGFSAVDARPSWP